MVWIENWTTDLWQEEDECVEKGDVGTGKPPAGRRPPAPLRRRRRHSPGFKVHFLVWKLVSALRPLRRAAGVEASRQGAGAAPGLQEGVAGHVWWLKRGGEHERESREQIPLGVAAGVQVRWKSRTLEYYSTRRSHGWVTMHLMLPGPAFRFDFVVALFAPRFRIPPFAPPRDFLGYNYAFLQIGQLVLALSLCLWSTVCVCLRGNRRRLVHQQEELSAAAGILDLHFPCSDCLSWFACGCRNCARTQSTTDSFPDSEF